MSSYTVWCNSITYNLIINMILIVTPIYKFATKKNTFLYCRVAFNKISKRNLRHVCEKADSKLT